MDHSRTANHWDTQHFDPVFLRAEWSFHPYAKARLHRQLGGVAAREEWFYFRHLAGRSGLRALGIGVGLCESELRLLSTGAIARYDLYDVSPAALAGGKADAERLGLADKATFNCADIHQTDLEPGSYDLITFIASLHHIDDLEGILTKCRRALAPGGLLWAAEYIGPDYFQFPDEHTELARRVFRILDPALKKPNTPELFFPSREEVISVDPTESVHSSDIESVMRRVWPDVEVIGTYGTFAFIMSWCMNQDAWYDTDLGREAFQTVLDLDTALIDSGQLPHYFAYFIARMPAVP